jgi:hypothetical protein
MSYLRNLCLLAYSGIQHILCCGFYCIRLVFYVDSLSRLTILDCTFGIL